MAAAVCITWTHFRGVPRTASAVTCRVQRALYMTTSSGLHFKTYCMLLIMVVFAPLGNVLLGKGMKGVGSVVSWSPSRLSHIVLLVLTSGYVWLGVAALLAFFIAYMLILSWADFSYVQPASSIALLVVALLGYFYLGERISALHWAGIVVICLGVFVVGNTPPRTTEER
ncbi:MAG TPA: hypothetical protein VGI46_19775 [Candidatus Acidoferrum sp.]|jgi:drug/metabolite transporter (DMT)-like permease